MNWPENFITRLFSLSVARELELEMNWLENFITRISPLPVARELDLDIQSLLSLSLHALKCNSTHAKSLCRRTSVMHSELRHVV